MLCIEKASKPVILFSTEQQHTGSRPDTRIEYSLGFVGIYTEDLTAMADCQLPSVYVL